MVRNNVIFSVLDFCFFSFSGSKLYPHSCSFVIKYAKKSLMHVRDCLALFLDNSLEYIQEILQVNIVELHIVELHIVEHVGDNLSVKRCGP